MDRDLKDYITGSLLVMVDYQKARKNIEEDRYANQLSPSHPANARILPDRGNSRSIPSEMSDHAKSRSQSLPNLVSSAMGTMESPWSYPTNKVAFRLDSRSVASLPLFSPYNAESSLIVMENSKDVAADANTKRSTLSDEYLRDRMVKEEIEAVQAEIASTKELHSLIKRVSGWVLTESDYQVVQNLLNSYAGYGQGIEVGRIALTVAFLLLQKYYRLLPNEFSNNIVLSKKDLETPYVIFKYAYAAHGWPALYFFGKRNDVISDFVGSDSNYRAVLQYLQLNPNDMLVCDLDQHRLFRPNFYVALDRRLDAVILSIRGTMSLRDTLTDLSFDYISWNGGIVHSGIMASANWFLNNVGKQLCLFAKEYRTKRVILTGHSLGGATAALTTIMLNEQLKGSKDWPMQPNGVEPVDLHCYSFGCPPILSPELARKYTNLIDAFLVGDDAVPRLSYGTMADLQLLMVYTAEIGRASELWGLMEGSELQRKLDTCRHAIRTSAKVHNPKLHIPGRLHHIQTLKAPNNRQYTVIDTCMPERFDEMTLRRNMLKDHLPSAYEMALENAYVTYIMHELEERQMAASPSLSLKEKLQAVITLSEGSVATSPSISRGSFESPVLTSPLPAPAAVTFAPGMMFPRRYFDSPPSSSTPP